MGNKHYKQQLSAFVGQELSKEDRQVVGEHLMNCDECRNEYQQIKLGADLALKLGPSDAPESVWRSIEAEVNGEQTPRLEAFESPRWFDMRHIGALATAIIVVGLITFFVYRGLFVSDSTIITQAPHDQFSQPGIPLSPPPSNVNASAVGNANSNTNAVQEASVSPNALPADQYWNVETIAGSPKVGSTDDSKLAVGEYLETDSRSRARIEVAEIGDVEIAPNSRVKLVGTSNNLHRLSLEVGGLHARISAPPRLFIVDTPSAAAVDLGCEYTLDVDKAGNSTLKVSTGFVALEQGGRESIVPAGAACLTMKGKGLGTPFSLDATPEFEKALRSFDFGGGGSRAVKEIVTEANVYDIVSLWHLLSRVKTADRGIVFDALGKFVAPPAGVTREGVLNLNRSMLEKYREAVEAAWFD